MTSQLTVHPVKTVPCDRQVRDYDQLDPTAKQYFAELESNKTAAMIPAQVAASFDCGEVIRYTVYFRIQSKA
jgi:hypothetical protein